jgi:kumamolisin
MSVTGTLKKAIKRPHTAAPASWKLTALCAEYDWPSGLTGGGVIGIVELGGGWIQSDVTSFFTGLGLPEPQITDVSVDGTTNDFTGDADADGEVALDLQIAGGAYAIATGKAATIRVYWSKDIATAVAKAAGDGCDVCSISWGADETDWGTTAAQQMETTATAATQGGMIIFAASGDNDSSDGGTGKANVDLPASCPHVIGCGGTKKTATAETVWNDNPGKTDGEGTGGGYSTIFPMPTWQAGAPHGPGRLVPDVAANADPETGYEIVVNGASEVVGGTSAVAPLYSGLFAAFGRKLGFVTPELYLHPACFNDITEGSNGAYRATTGVDPCSGLGSPIASRLAALFTAPGATAARQIRALRQENTSLRLAASPADPAGPPIMRPYSETG